MRGPLVFLVALLAAARPSATHGAVAPDPALDVAAAADLRYALEELGRAFERQAGVRVRFSFGSSGQLAAQVAYGAPFDVFLSADAAFVDRLVRSGDVVAKTVRPYGVGRLVLWVRREAPLDPAQGLRVLEDRRVRFVAIATPDHAPYGAAAREALLRDGRYARVRSKLVYGDNVGHALQLVQTGNADAGLVALSLALAPPVAPHGRYWVIPQMLHAPILQVAGVVARSRRQAAALAFLDFVTGPAGRPVMRRYGFVLPGEGP